MCDTDTLCVVLLCGFCIALHCGVDMVRVVKNMFIDGVNVCMNIERKCVGIKFSDVRPQNILMLLMFK